MRWKFQLVQWVTQGFTSVVFVCMVVYVKKRTNIYLDEKQKETLKKLSLKTGVPVAEIVRRAINEYLRQPARR